MEEKKRNFFRTQVLNLIQAMYGYITPNYRCISLLVKKNVVYIYIILEEHNSAEISEIQEDCMTEFEALQEYDGIDYNLNIKSSNLKDIRCTDKSFYSMTIYQRKEESFLNEQEYYD